MIKIYRFTNLKKKHLSYKRAMITPEETMVDYNQVFDKLVNEITTAQAELDMIQEQLKNQRSIDSVGLQAATLQEETKLWKKETPEGFVEDDQIRYYLAVGQVEQQVCVVHIWNGNCECRF